MCDIPSLHYCAAHAFWKRGRLRNSFLGRNLFSFHSRRTRGMKSSGRAGKKKLNFCRDFKVSGSNLAGRSFVDSFPVCHSFKYGRGTRILVTNCREVKPKIVFTDNGKAPGMWTECAASLVADARRHKTILGIVSLYGTHHF